jgi:hypothetical protein
LREARQAVAAARARVDTALGQQLLAGLRERYDKAAAFGRTHNRLRDWHEGNHPGYALGSWLRDYKEQVFLFTRNFAVDWTNNISERGAKAAKRHQAVSGYWHSPRHPRPLVPDQKLPGNRRSPRHHRTRRHHQRHRRKTLATATPRHRLTPVHGAREWTPRWPVIDQPKSLTGGPARSGRLVTSA